jgi:hypothetical protein
MATYKLIQDIEAEDHILGPLTLRQFIFGMIAVFLFYICFIVVAKHVVFLLVPVLPPALFFGFFALPFGRDQPTEVWFLAKLRFWFKPRRRVWNQSGVKELVTITVPKKVERVLTNGLSQTEVKSRLNALAQTLDSRGWVVKHVAFGNDASTYMPLPVVGGDPDRLIALDSLPQEVPTIEAAPVEDMMDETTSPLARQFDSMMDRSSQARRQQLMDQMKAVPDGQGSAAVAPAATLAAPDNWFMGQTHAASPPLEPVVSGSVASAADDDALSAQLAARANRSLSFGNLRTMQPVGKTPAADASATPAVNPVPPMTAAPDPAILSLASSNDLNVATLARQAKKNQGEGSSDEVVISLH